MVRVACCVGVVVGLCIVELYLHDALSLKSKRRVLASLKQRLQARFNISFAEIGKNDLWQKQFLELRRLSMKHPE